jgi:long-chain acyl-CoA synthetase
MQSLADFTLEVFRSHKSKTAFVQQTGFRNKETTYGEIADGAFRIASAFQQLGIQPGDRIIIWGENSARWVMTFYACLLSRVVAVPLDASFTEEFVNKIAATIEARLICSDQDGTAWNKLLESSNSFKADTTVPPPETLLEIIYTSGTTGDPKGVMITHGNILANLLPVHKEIQKYLKYTKLFSQFGFVHLIPLSHLFGQVMGLFIPQMLGAKIIFADPAPPQVVRAVKTNHASAVICVPHELSLLRKMVERQQIAKPSETKGALKRWWKHRKVHRMFGLKFWAFIVGGATLPKDEEQFWHKLGFAVIQGYGLTETAPSITITHPFKGIVQGSVGKVLPGLEVKIADDGEVLVRGANVSPGYFRNENATREMFENGWLRTGDLGRFDENRNLILVGRKKEVIVLPGGMNVYPEDVEAALNGQIAVRESAVVSGGSDEKPRVHAVLVLCEGSGDEAIAKANAILQPHQQIQSWSIWPQDQLPRTSTGKLKRLAIQKGTMATSAQEPQVEQIASKILEGRFDSSKMDSDLGLSSLERLELMMELEQKAGIEINETEFTKAKTMSDVARLIDQPPERKSEEYSAFTWRLWWPLRMFRKFAWYGLASPAMRIRMKVHASGLENLKNIDGSILFVSNHQSILDPPVILKALPRSWRKKLAPAMGTNRRKIDLMASSLFFNSYPLPVTGTGLRAAIQHTGWLADHGYCPLIFPEGKRTQDGTMFPFRPGIGVIVKETGLRVLPIVLRGAFEVWPETARGPAKGNIHVHFGPLFDFAGKQPEEITKELEDWYKQNY